MGQRFVGHHPIRSKSGYCNRPGLNAYFAFGCPRSPRLAPRSSYVYLPMNPLVAGCVPLHPIQNDPVGFLRRLPEKSVGLSVENC
jgi:hypothetical protein